MNQWGELREPFLFIISYDQQRAYLWKEQDVPAHVYYSLPIMQRKAAQSTLPIPIEFCPQPLSRDDYAPSFYLAQKEIRAGNSYLLNLCAATKLDTNLRLVDFYSHANAPYKLLVEGEFCCFSPEAFVSMRDSVISTYPMKGTISAATPNALTQLMESEKESCEHATIVDLLRNDLSRVSSDVTVPRYRYAELVETSRGAIYQTSSEISGSLPSHWRSQLGDIFSHLLPAGSITGAPKKKTCEIIAQAELMERGFYTGVFGFFDGESLESAVCIRFVEQDECSLYYKSGGGITAMSELDEEYRELIEKVYVPFAT